MGIVEYLCDYLCGQKKSEAFNLNICSSNSHNINHNIREINRIININCCSPFSDNINIINNEDIPDYENNIIFGNIEIAFCHINFNNVIIKIKVDRSITIDKLLRTYYITLGVPNLINSDMIKFTYNDKYLEFKNYETIREFFGYNNIYQVNVFIPFRQA